MNLFSLNDVIIFSVIYWFSLLVPISGCGVPEIQPIFQEKIINGYEARENSWPWMVSLREKSGQFYSNHICGGVIIDMNTIVTAAHCLITQIPSRFAIFVGLHNSRTLPLSSDIYAISQIFIHPEFNKSTARNDISVIKLERSLVFSEKVSAVCLPSNYTHELLYSKVVVTTGWGLTQNGRLPTGLQQATLKILNNSFFDEIEQNLSIFVPTEQYAVIEDSENPDTNICLGDSGGPLVYYDGSKWSLCGIASYGLRFKNNGSCAVSSPSFFSSIPFHLDFINSFSNYSVSSSSNLLIFQLEFVLMAIFSAIINIRSH